MNLLACLLLGLSHLSVVKKVAEPIMSLFSTPASLAMLPDPVKARPSARAHAGNKSAGAQNPEGTNPGGKNAVSQRDPQDFHSFLKSDSDPGSKAEASRTARGGKPAQPKPAAKAGEAEEKPPCALNPDGSEAEFAQSEGPGDGETPVASLGRITAVDEAALLTGDEDISQDETADTLDAEPAPALQLAGALPPAPAEGEATLEGKTPAGDAGMGGVVAATAPAGEETPGYVDMLASAAGVKQGASPDQPTESHEGEAGAKPPAAIAGAADMPAISEDPALLQQQGVAAPELEKTKAAVTTGAAGTGSADAKTAVGQETAAPSGPKPAASLQARSEAAGAALEPEQNAQADVGKPGIGGNAKAEAVEALAPRKPTTVPAIKEAAPQGAAFAELIRDLADAQGLSLRAGDHVGGIERMAGNGPHGTGEALRPTPLQMLPVEIGMNAMRGVTKFQIRLDPAELGRVDVKLEIRDNGEVRANLVVERVETLAMLRRDSASLQQAFEQAGLKQSPDGLSFSLRDDQSQNQPQGRQTSSQPGLTPDEESLALQNEISAFAMRRVLIPNASLDRVV